MRSRLRGALGSLDSRTAIAGGLKILYDGLVYLTFRNVHPPEEIERRRRGRDAA